MKPHLKAAPVRTAAIVHAEIAALDETARPRIALLAELEAERPALIERGDIDAIEALDAKIRRARIEGEVDAARRAKLAAEHQDLDAAERYAADQAARRAAYDAARSSAEEARRLYHEEYPRLARELANLLARTEELGEEVTEANARLPDGARAIPMTFEPFRGRVEVRPTTQKFKRHYWVNKISGQEVYQFTDDPKNYEKRTRDEEMQSPGAPAIPHVPLRHLVSLPGLAFADNPFWTANAGFLAPPAGSPFTDYRQVSPPLGGGAPRSMAHLGGRS